MKTFDNRNLAQPQGFAFAPKAPAFTQQPGIIGNQTIVLSEDATGSGTTAITVKVVGIQGYAVPAPGVTAGNLRWNGGAWSLDTTAYLSTTAQSADSAKLGGLAAASYALQSWVTTQLGSYALTTALPVAGTIAPAMDGTQTIGSTGKWSDSGHIHPTDTSRLAASGTAANSSQLLGSTWAAPAAIGNSTPGMGWFSRLTMSGAVILNGNSGYVSGSIYTDATYGLVDWAKTGSANDWSVMNPAGSGFIMNAPTGTLNVQFGGNVLLPAAGVVKVNSTQVLGAQQTGIGATIGAYTLSGTYATDLAKLQLLYNQVLALVAALKTHGLVAT